MLNQSMLVWDTKGISYLFSSIIFPYHVIKWQYVKKKLKFLHKIQQFCGLRFSFPTIAKLMLTILFYLQVTIFFAVDCYLVILYAIFSMRLIVVQVLWLCPFFWINDWFCISRFKSLFGLKVNSTQQNFEPAHLSIFNNILWSKLVILLFVIGLAIVTLHLI